MSTQAAAATPTTPAQTPAAAQPAKGAEAQKAQPTQADIRKLRLKLEGQELELPESEVIELAQKGAVAGKRFQEAAEIKRQAMEVMKHADENPAEFLTKKGKDVRKWAEEYLMGELKREQMTPEQKKAFENEAKLKEYEAKDKQAKEETRQKEMEELQKKHAENYNKLFIEALTKSGLPRTAYTVKRMAELQLVNMKKQFNLDADQLAKIVREDYESEAKSLFGAWDGDQLMSFLGPEMMKKLSKAQIAKLKSKGARSANATATATRSSHKPGMTWREYQLKNRRRT